MIPGGDGEDIVVIFGIIYDSVEECITDFVRNSECYIRISTFEDLNCEVTFISDGVQVSNDEIT